MRTARQARANCARLDGATMTITVYHLETSRSERIVWLMEELGLPYEIEVFPRETTGAAPHPLKAIHPLGKAPAIRDGDVVLAESGAIVDYVVHRHGGGRLALPPGAPAYARYLYWLHFAEGSLMSLLLIVLVLSRVKEAAASPVTARMRERMKQMLSFVDAEFGGGPWFAGEAFTAADVMMVFPFTTLRNFLDYDLAPYANIVAYLARVGARPAYRKAMSLAGPTKRYV
jgi:glutathione S-transferase